MVVITARARLKSRPAKVVSRKSSNLQVRHSRCPALRELAKMVVGILIVEKGEKNEVDTRSG